MTDGDEPVEGERTTDDPAARAPTARAAAGAGAGARSSGDRTGGDELGLDGPASEDAGPDDAGPDDAGPDDAGPDDAGPDDAGPHDPTLDELGLDDPAVAAEVAAVDELAAVDESSTEDPVTALALERDDYRDALIRLQADFENYKKRMIKQQTDHLEWAAGALVEKLLPVLDTADLALAHGGGEDVKQLAASLSSVLEREGLERIDPLGVPFDPMVHDAVAHEPGDGAQEVVEVMRAGYRWKGKVLRPAMVKVRG
jgi:molecular chaperone GrpE